MQSPPFVAVQIAGTGHVLAGVCVPSKVSDRELGLEPGRLEALTGMASRPVCHGEDQIGLAVATAEAASTATGDLALIPVADADTSAGVSFGGLALVA